MSAFREVQGVLQPYCHKVLPLVYDDSLSYYEQLCKLTSAMNDVIEDINTIPDQIEEALVPFKADYTQQLNEMREYVNSETAEMTNYVDLHVSLLEHAFDDYKQEMNTNMVDFKLLVNQTLADYQRYMDEQIQTVYVTLNNKFDLMEQQLESDFKEQRDWLEDQLAEIREEIDNLKFELPKMLNPTTGKEDAIVNTILDVYDADRDGGYTALQFDDSGVTVEEFEYHKRTAIKLDLYGLLYFGKLVLFSMRNPFTGLVQDTKDVINYLAYKYMNQGTLCYTCQGYDSKEMTAQTFDDTTNLTVADFDFNSIAKLV